VLRFEAWKGGPRQQAVFWDHWEDKMNNMELAGALVTAPSAAFADLKEKPRFWFPLLTVCLTTAAIFIWYYSIVDIEWLRDRLLSANPRMDQMTDQQREAAAKFMSANFLMWSSVASIVITIPIMRALEAVYFTLAGNVANVRYKFEHWFSLACWTGLPHVIGTAAMVVYLLTANTNQISNEELSLLSLNELFFHKSMTEPGFALLSSITLIHPWVWWLTVLGVRVWSGRSWLFSSVFALLPVVILYGAWAAWAFVR
jgi:Yip1 domain